MNLKHRVKATATHFGFDKLGIANVSRTLLCASVLVTLGASPPARAQTEEPKSETAAVPATKLPEKTQITPTAEQTATATPIKKIRRGKKKSATALVNAGASADPNASATPATQTEAEAIPAAAPTPEAVAAPSATALPVSATESTPAAAAATKPAETTTAPTPVAAGNLSEPVTNDAIPAAPAAAAATKSRGSKKMPKDIEMLMRKGKPSITAGDSAKAVKAAGGKANKRANAPAKTNSPEGEEPLYDLYTPEPIGDEVTDVERERVEIQPGQPLKFNTDGNEQSLDHRGPLDFKFEGVPSNGFEKQSAPISSDDSTYTGERFVLNPGYPKQSVGASLRPYSINAAWSFSGQDFNYTTESIGYGVYYRFQSTPQFQFDADYNTYKVDIVDTSVSPYTIAASSATLSALFARGTYCFIGAASFFNQFCLGGDLGYETYPLLDFKDATTLSLNSIKDVIVGAHIAYRRPLYGSFSLKLVGTYTMGTGGGSGGALTSKQNNAYAFNADVLWEKTEHHGFVAGVEYKARSASLSGKRGNFTDSWTTTAAMAVLHLDYQYTF